MSSPRASFSSLTTPAQSMDVHVNIELPANLFPQDIAATMLHAEVLVAEEAVQRDEGIDTFDNYALAVDTIGKVQYYGPKHEGMVRKMFRLEAFWKE